jgi:hypothetical protein
MSKLIRVQYRIKSPGIKPGDRDWVSEAVAADLVANRHALAVGEKDDEAEAPKAKK